VPGFEFGLDVVEGADLIKLNRPAFPKSHVEKELEAERVRELIDRGIWVPSESPYATNNILVGKKRNLDGSAGGMRVTSDFHALNAVTEYLAYPTEDVKAIVRWLATKQVYLVADLRDGVLQRESAEEGSALDGGEDGSGSTSICGHGVGSKGCLCFFPESGERGECEFAVHGRE
jgi:hypothetical protein